MKARSYMGNEKVSRASHLFQSFMPYGQVSRLAAVEKFHAPGVLFQGFTPCGCFKVEGGGD